MYQVIIIFIFLSFLQATLIPINFVFLLLIGRSFVVDEKSNYWLAFGFGLLLSLLLHQNLGILSLMFLLTVKCIHLLRRTQLFINWLAMLGVSIFFIATLEGLEKLFLGEHFSVTTIIVEALLMLPIYLIIKFWEERFTPKKDIRLKVSTR